MNITPLLPEGTKIIQAYGDGRFRVSGNVHEGSVFVFSRHVLAWEVTRPEAVTWESFGPVIEAEEAVEILLFGSGKETYLLPKEIRARLREHGIAVETMDTGAACRTYNVLAAEERRVAAALIAVD
ncbi:MAG: Mth938-like domain-containing protein [Pseudomonadota bacterium]